MAWYKKWQIYLNFWLFSIWISIQTFVCINFFDAYSFRHSFVSISCTNIFWCKFVSALGCENYSNIHIFIEFPIQIFIRTFISVIFLMQIHLDILLCNFLYKYIMTFSHVICFTNVTLWLGNKQMSEHSPCFPLLQCRIERKLLEENLDLRLSDDNFLMEGSYIQVVPPWGRCRWQKVLMAPNAPTPTESSQ